MRKRLTKYKFTNIILFRIAALSFLVFATFIILLIYYLKKTTINQANNLIELNTKDYATINKSELEKPLNLLKNLIYAYQGINQLLPNERRDFICKSLRNTLEVNPDFSGIGLVWDTNTLDGLDSSFVNTLGSSKLGRFLPYYNRTNNTIELHETIYAETANWYIIPKSKLQDFIDEPLSNNINNQEVLSIRISSPIIIDGVCEGVIFVDYSFDNIKKINSQSRILNTGYGQLISNNGIILTNPNKRFINKTLEDFNSINEQFSDAINKNVYFYSLNYSKQINAKCIKAFAPFKIGNSSNTFIYNTIVPYTEINKIFISYVKKVILLSFILYVLLVLFIYFILRNKTKTLNKAVQNLKSIANTGSIEKIKNFDKPINDEIDEIPQIIDKLFVELSLKAKFAHEIKEGNLSYPYEKQSNEDAFGNTLIEVKKSLIKSEAEEKQRKLEDDNRNWVAEGLTKFAEISRTHNTNIETLSYEVIHNLVKYIKANQGGVFLINEDYEEKYLELTACFAYDRQKFLSKKVFIGEGLVSSCFLEKQSIYLTNIPPNYINISSGLGDSNPNTVLLVPLKISDDNFGVIEIASFAKIESYQKEFVERVAEIIASTISSVKINMKTALLLAQSQEQAEEMKAQEEEMRQNMEELTATQESLAEKDVIKQKEIDKLNKIIEEKTIELHHKDSEYFSKIEEIDLESKKVLLQNKDLIQELNEIENKNLVPNFLFQNIVSVILDAELIFISSNNLFLELIEKKIDELIGKSFASIFNSIENKDEFKEIVLHYIKNQRNFSKQILFIKPNKENIWLKIIFYPIFSTSNKIENIIVCLYDITDMVLNETKLKKELADLNTEINNIKQAKEIATSIEKPTNIAITKEESPSDIIDFAFIREEYAPDGKMIGANNNFEKLYEYIEKDINQINIISLIPEKSKKEFKMIWNSLLRGKFFKGETQRLTKLGNEIWLSSIYKPIMDEKNKVYKIIFIGIDISATKKFEIENQLQAEKLKECEATLDKLKNFNTNTTKQNNKKRKT